MSSSTPTRTAGHHGSPARNQATRNTTIFFPESSFTTPPRNDLRDRRLLSPPALVQNNHRSRRHRVGTQRAHEDLSDFAFNLDACLAQLGISRGHNVNDTIVVNKDDEELDREVADINNAAATNSNSSGRRSSAVSSYTLPFRLSGREDVVQASPSVNVHPPSHQLPQ